MQKYIKNPYFIPPFMKKVGLGAKQIAFFEDIIFVWEQQIILNLRISRHD